MLPEKIKQRIAQYYLPGSIGNYDQIITADHFESLFAPVENVNHEQILQALNDSAYFAEATMGDYYLVLFATNHCS